MRIRWFMLLRLVILINVPALADEARLLRFPHVQGDRVTFVYAGDIYIAPRTGGQATRLTNHEGLELFPRLSPDASKVAFCGEYDGDMSVYVMPAGGGAPTRLTYHPGIQPTSERFGPENIVMGWHPDGQRVLFRSRKESNDWWDGRAYLVGVEGGLPIPLPMHSAGFTSLSPDAGKVAYCPIYRDFRTWKRYKGGMAQDVWIFDLKTLAAEKITDWVGTDNVPMWYQDRIYFNSDRTGTLNLFCYDTVSKETRQVTDFTEYDVRWPGAGTDGIAFENGGYLYVMDLPGETLHKVTITLAYDRVWMRPTYVGVSDKTGDADISPNGKRVVFSARGDVFTVPAKEGNTNNLTGSSGANDREPRWSPDSKWVAFISDRSGEEELYLMSHDGADTMRLTQDGYCHKYGPVWSPDSKMLAFSDKELDVFLLEVASKRLTKIDKTDRNEVRNFGWSPDSRYLAYTKRGDNRISAIYVFSVDDRQVHQVTPGFTNDYQPEFDPGGKYLYFLSERNFNPIMSNYEPQFVNNAITDLYLILLSADEKSPFAPKSDEAVSDEADEKAESEDAGQDEKEKKPVEVHIDFAGIYDRQVSFDLPAGNYGWLMAVEDAVFYLSRPIYGLRGKASKDDQVLYKYDLKKEKNHEFASGVTPYALTADGSKMLVKKASDYHIIATSGDKASFEDTEVDLSHMEMHLDRSAEYQQMFDEVWRMERDFFYDEEMHGVDWEAVYRKYAVLLPYVANRFDLTYLIGEMVGELACSHTYVGGGDRPEQQSSKVGLLGVDLEIDDSSGRLRIARILDGENWDDDLRSPLQEPGLDVREGDYLLAIDGRDVGATSNPYSLLQNCADRIVTLTVNDRPNRQGAREVLVKPIKSEEMLRYYNWVEDRRRHVDSVSNGQIGYIHLPDMSSFGLVRFTKMFYHQIRKPGIIIDVRYNGGGWVSGLILERLRREVIAMHASRTFANGPGPGSAITGHMITLLNQFSCSDGDYFPYFFREYGLGPLMGVRSWGGVIGIRGYRPLVDGGYYTAPEFSIYSLDGEWVMENIGVEPDIMVENLPTREAQGHDDQLDQAIAYLLNKIEVEPVVLPPVPDPPTPR